MKALEKLKLRLAEAEAALESRKKPPEEIGTKIVGEGLVIDEWVSSLDKSLNLYFIFSSILTPSNVSFPVFTSCRKREEKDTWPDNKLKAWTQFK